MKKRLLSLLLASIMVFSVAACGNATGETEVTSTETSEVVENYVPTYPIVEEPITITALLVNKDTTISETRTVWEEVEALTNIHIEWEVIDADAYTTRLASGQWPDLIAHKLDNSSIYDYGVLGGRFVNYLDYLDIMPNLKKAIEDYPYTLAYAQQDNGEMYNLFRVSGELPTSVYCRPHYLKHVLDGAGVTEAPTTVEEFYDALVKCKETYGSPSYIHLASVTGYQSSIFGAFGPLTQTDFSDDGTGKLVFAPTTEQMKLYYEFLHKLYEEDLMNKEYVTLDRAARLKLAQTGQYAFITPDAAENLTIEDVNGDWMNLGTLVPFTSEYDETRECIGYPDYYVSHGMFINKDSQYVEEICKMLDICFATEEVAPGTNLKGTNFGWGPEHVVWENNGDGTYTEIVPEGFENKSKFMATYTWDSVGRNDAIAGLVGSNLSNQTRRQAGYIENIHPYKSDRYVDTVNMRFTEDEQYVISNKYGEIQEYCQQMEAAFISGSADIETEWDTFVQTLEQMGAAEVTAVFQAAYDRFNAAVADAAAQ